jgi:hypothetical protein
MNLLGVHSLPRSLTASLCSAWKTSSLSGSLMQGSMQGVLFTSR